EFQEHSVGMFKNLNQALDNPGQVTGLKIKVKSQLDESIGNLSQLKQLYIQSEELTALPASMEKLISLEVLYLSCKSFTLIPDFIFKLPKLTFLNLASCN